MLKDVKSEMEKLVSRATSQPKEKSLQEQVSYTEDSIMYIILCSPITLPSDTECSGPF